MNDRGEAREFPGWAIRRHIQAVDDFPAARAQLLAAGRHLLCHSETHYTLRGNSDDAGWYIDLYPVTQEHHLHRAPRFAVFGRAKDWTLLDVAAEVADGNV